MGLEHSVGLRIRAFRKQQGLTQEQLAERIERTSDAISQLERGINLPGFDTLERLSEALDVPIAAFFESFGESGEGNKHRQRLIAELLASVARLSDQDLDRLLNVVRTIWQEQG
tara:strand:- start:41 stop:382 length:342 start_codon:yes stop_codon:yes gene_type:complete